MSTTVSFPGLGIEPFSFDRVAFDLFGKPIYWYGVIIMLGIVAAFIHAYLRCKQEGIKGDDILDVGLFTVIFGVIGARLYYVVTSLDTHNYDSFIDVIAIWEGGLAIYGGIIAGTVAILLTCLYKKINPLKVMDTIAPGVALAQAMGRWGNFANGEAFGEIVTEGHPLYALRMGLVSSYSVDYTNSTEMHYFHPTFLYESLWNIVGFVIITLLYRKKKFNGQVTLMYFAWYGFGRMFIEGLRTDSLYVGSFRISQVVGAVCFLAGSALLVAGFILSSKGKFDKWLKVRWAEELSAEGEAVIKTVSGKMDSASTETVADGNPATDSAEEEAPLPPADGEENTADDTDTP